MTVSAALVFVTAADTLEGRCISHHADFNIYMIMIPRRISKLQPLN